MSSFNLVVLMGNLTRDPEMRYTPKGTPVAEIGLAVNRKWKTEDGELREEVSFFNCAAFGRTAEIIHEYLRKGAPLLIHGRLKQETWDDKQTGAKRFAVKIIIESMTMIGGGNRQEGGQDQRPPQGRSRQQTQSAPSDDPGQGNYPPEEGDDVPF